MSQNQQSSLFPTSTTSNVLSFGTPNQPPPPMFGAPTTGGFNFGAQSMTSPPQSQPASLFGQAAGPTPTGAFNFGAPALAAQPQPQSSLFTAPVAAPAPGTGGYNFGAGTTMSMASQAQPLSLFATAPTSAPQSGAINFGAPSFTGTPQAQPSTGLFSVPSAATALSFGTTNPATAQAQAPSLFPGMAAPATTLSFGAPPNLTATTTAGMTFAFPTSVPASSTSVPGTSAAPLSSAFASPATSTIPKTLGTTFNPAGGVTSAAAPATSSASSFVAPFVAGAPQTVGSVATPVSGAPKTTRFSLFTPATSATTSVTPSAVTPAAQLTSLPQTPATTTAATVASAPMTFRQLEDHINIWFNELNQLETDFQQQAQTINSWDSLLVANALKITQINEQLDTLKSDHTRVDHQLDFIISQQNELESLLEPLEEIKIEGGVQESATAEREETYSLMEQVNNDLQTIGGDLQSFIKKLNEGKSNQDVRDPLSAINKILNSHMDALQYIENQLSVLKETVQV